MPPQWHAIRTPHTSDALPESTLKEGCKPLGFVAYPCFFGVLPSIGSTACRQSSPGPPNPESRAEEVIVEDAEPYHENPPLTPPVPPSTLTLRPRVLPVVLGSSLPVAVLPIPLSSQGILPKSSLSEMCRPRGGCRQRAQRNVVSPSLRSTRMEKHGSSR